jgi:tetratricopeptide (TPR) repeat protein
VPTGHPLHGLLGGALLAGAALWGACARPQRPPLEIEYAGCAQVFVPGPVCTLDEKSRELSFWVRLPPEVPVEVRTGGSWRRSAAAAVAGGQRLTVTVPARAAAVELRAVTPQGESVWTLALTAPRKERGDGLGKQARAALHRGAYEEAAALLAQSIAAHHAAGSLLAEASDATVLVWIEIQRSRFAAARQVLSGLELRPGSPAEAVWYRSYYSGLLAEKTGDVRSALADFAAAVGQAERVGAAPLRYAAEQVLARQLQALGRSREAVELYERLRHTPPPGLAACDAADLLINEAWSLLLAGEVGQRLIDPVPLLAEAQRVAERDQCPPVEETRLNYFLNMALAHLQAGRPAQARAFLSAARGLERFSKPSLELWSLDLEARLDLASERPAAALKLYDRLDELAAGSVVPEGRWRASYGRALCQRALGRTEEALTAFARAESLLDAQSLQIPIQEGRARFVAQREGATGLYLGLLLDGGRNAEALEVARRARSRVLRQLARGDRLADLKGAGLQQWGRALNEYWQLRSTIDSGTAADRRLPADQLRRAQAARAALAIEAGRALDRAFAVLGGVDERALPPQRPGEVVLAYHPLARGWVGFAAAGGSVTVHRFELPEDVRTLPPAEQAARLLEPFRAAIARSQRVRVLPYGALRAVDFHALPFGGDILLAARPVVYGLDLATSAGDRPAGRRALVVANPSGNLPAAGREGRAVAADLRGQQPAWSAEVLQGQAATADAVRRALAGADLFHYAGHGVFSGSGGWESVLRLAGGSELTLGDLLALQRAPSWVVLSACEGGRSSADAPVEGLGLAYAFLLAGSRSVIAATQPVHDSTAQGLLSELYEGWSAAPDPAALLRERQLAWRRRHRSGGWQSFRLFEP